MSIIGCIDWTDITDLDSVDVTVALAAGATRFCDCGVAEWGCPQPRERDHENE